MTFSTHSNPTKASGFSNPAMLFEAMVERFGRFLRFRRTMTELSALSDSQLADLGLTRSMLHSAAREATYGTNH
jgi:uncharacterized protein YjiS (DUF1127 family)